MLGAKCAIASGRVGKVGFVLSGEELKHAGQGVDPISTPRAAWCVLLPLQLAP